MISGAKKLDAVVSEIIGRKEFIIFPESTEEIDMNEIKYFCFPNLNTPSFKVNNVANASTMDRKRLRAHLYIGTIDDRNQILTVINQAIEWLLTLKNPPSPTIQKENVRYTFGISYVSAKSRISPHTRLTGSSQFSVEG